MGSPQASSRWQFFEPGLAQGPSLAPVGEPKQLLGFWSYYYYYFYFAGTTGRLLRGREAT